MNHWLRGAGRGDERLPRRAKPLSPSHTGLLCVLPQHPAVLSTPLVPLRHHLDRTALLDRHVARAAKAYRILSLLIAFTNAAPIRTIQAPLSVVVVSATASAVDTFSKLPHEGGHRTLDDMRSLSDPVELVN